MLYGRRFTEQNAPRLVAFFGDWVRNIANGQLVGFFDELGVLLREALAEMDAAAELYEGERSVLQVYVESGALDRHDEESIVGLLSMTLMAAVFNTQVSLAWILVHLYADDELLARARAEIDACDDLRDYQALSELEFLNSCIDEAVRLHTMLPGNTVLRKANRDVTIGDATVKAGSVLWLYPNAVHQDADYFPQPASFCPMRLLGGNLERMSDEYELVTFGHGQKRCIGEKMARAMIISFLATLLPAADARAPDELPDDGFFDLIPASELKLLNLRRRGAAAGGADACGATDDERRERDRARILFGARTTACIARRRETEREASYHQVRRAVAPRRVRVPAFVLVDSMCNLFAPTGRSSERDMIARQATFYGDGARR